MRCETLSLVVYVVGVVFALAMSGVFHLLEPDGTPRAVLRASITQASSS